MNLRPDRMEGVKGSQGVFKKEVCMRTKMQDVCGMEWRSNGVGYAQKW